MKLADFSPLGNMAVQGWRWQGWHVESRRRVFLKRGCLKPVEELKSPRKGSV